MALDSISAGPEHPRPLRATPCRSTGSGSSWPARSATRSRSATASTRPRGRRCVVGHYAEVVALAAEFEAMELDLAPLGPLSLAVLARVPLGEWDGALADQARVARAARRASGRVRRAWRAAATAPRRSSTRRAARRAGADAVLAVIDGVGAPAASGRGTGRLRWPRRRSRAEASSPQPAPCLDRLARNTASTSPRELEARCTLIAEEGAWDEAAGVIAASRRHAERGRLRRAAVPRRPSGGRALLAAGDADGALELLERAVAGFAALAAALGGRADRARARRGARGTRPRRRRRPGARAAPPRCSSGCASRASSSGRELTRDAQALEHLNRAPQRPLASVPDGRARRAPRRTRVASGRPPSGHERRQIRERARERLERALGVARSE